MSTLREALTAREARDLGWSEADEFDGSATRAADERNLHVEVRDELTHPILVPEPAGRASLLMPPITELNQRVITITVLGHHLVCARPAEPLAMRAPGQWCTDDGLCHVFAAGFYEWIAEMSTRHASQQRQRYEDFHNRRGAQE